MNSAAKESILPDRLSERLGGLILKDEQRLAVEALKSGEDVLAVLPTGFGKSVIYQSFVISRRIPLPSLLLFLFGVSSMINYSQMILT